MNTRVLASLCTLTGVLFSHTVLAAFISPEWERGSVGSAYLEWDAFSGLVSTSPDIGSDNIASSTLTEQIGQSFVTSSGNLYSFTSAQSYSLAVRTDENGPSPIADTLQVQLQIRTWTWEIEDRLVTLNGEAGAVTLLAEGEGEDPVFGTYTRYEYLFEWTVAASSLYQFNWNLDELSTSLDAVVLDMYSDGSTDGLLSYPDLDLLPTIPGSELFDGNPFSRDDLFVGGSGERLQGSGAPAAVPVPAAAPLFISALLALLGLKRRSRSV